MAKVLHNLWVFEKKLVCPNLGFVIQTPIKSSSTFIIFAIYSHLATWSSTDFQNQLWNSILVIFEIWQATQNKGDTLLRIPKKILFPHEYTVHRP